MFDGRAVAFRLPGGNPALSAVVVNGDSFAAVDGREKAVYLYSVQGKLLEAFPTVRAYETIVKMGNTGYLALPRCVCRRFSYRVYVLNCAFEEVGCLDLQVLEEGDCETLMDLFYTEEGEILGAFRYGLRSFDSAGNQTSCEKDRSSRFLYNVARNGALTALHRRLEWGDGVTVSWEGESVTGILSCRLALRDLLPWGEDGFYGLFGYRYQYNYLLPVYKDGRLCLPEETALLDFLQNIPPCS